MDNQIKFHRTDESRFESLPDFDYQPVYREWRGLRIAHVDVPASSVNATQLGTVLLQHGEPTWSFLWRKTIAVLSAAGYRCIAMDLPGFGRSDKPIDFDWYSYDNHTAALVDLIDDLQLEDLTVVCHDWGGPIGLRVATLERPHVVSRIVAMDTGVFDGQQTMSPAWHAFADFVRSADELPIGALVSGGCASPPAADVVAAYEAPHDHPDAHAGARSFPLLIPQTPTSAGAEEGAKIRVALQDDTRPHLVMWGANDPVLPADPLAGLVAKSLLKNAGDPQIIENAGHFLPEDQGDEVGRRIVSWLTSLG